MWLAVNLLWEMKGLEIGVCVFVYAPRKRHQSITSNTLHGGRAGSLVIAASILPSVPTLWYSLLFHIVAYWNPLSACRYRRLTIYQDTHQLTHPPGSVAIVCRITCSSVAITSNQRKPSSRN